MIVQSGCTNASESICGSLSPSAYRAMAPSLVCMDPAVHVKEVAEQGYTIVEDAIEPDLIAELGDSLDRLERVFDVQPSPNSFEGHKTLRIYNLLAFDDVWQRVPV